MAGERVPTSAFAAALHRSKSVPEHEPVPEVIHKSISESIPELVPESVPVPVHKPIPEPVPVPTSGTDYVLELRMMSERKKRHAEDVRKRQTYLLSREEINAVEELCKDTGLDKYEVVGRSVLDLRRRFREQK